ncbi:uncharacterized protein LOC111289343 [Durio zibethinus]|uniref:Uncharacterized protein LOC111289343 n=1 Tax=Durio zibethinus TaxID=66656 RepID=A0A6P5Y6L3_DURZI|nr:uncharacterized protein LOC111289343 [Durio zibethinus]
MSIIISSLLIFFLCLPMHACNARDLGVLIDHNNNASHKKLPLSNKALESVKQLNRDDTISVHDEGTSGDDIVFHDSHVVKPKDSDSLHRELMKPKRDISAAPVPVKPLVSVSGRVPRKNLDERTGLFSDYSRPRTRPPSHN